MADSKRKKKAKKTPEKKRDKNKSQEEPQGSKKNSWKKKNKGEMRKCTYYSKGYHPKSSCMKTQLDGMTPFEAWSGHKPYVTHFRIFGSKAWDRIPTEKRKALQPQIQECLLVWYYEYSKGKNMIKLSTKKSFIEISVQFKEDPLAAIEVGESSSPPQRLIVSEETNEFVDYDMYDNDELIAYPNIPTRTK